MDKRIAKGLRWMAVRGAALSVVPCAMGGLILTAWLSGWWSDVIEEALSVTPFVSVGLSFISIGGAVLLVSWLAWGFAYEEDE